ncbi:hypothetical protein HOF56_03950 [Candidatus Peribacteria bacterium]|nr:hypothetical protein [Candidatus Peribacteria bacterium]MBT4021424.1 hypothetical protein [Candidatus Peribacteria bacterium]MBT4240440.1 hypothetical protein [Candidatus Peribacteria bacterium]MBT4474522.1 hypothetical protein [Candidatus Peribacteria bacterium]
MLEKDDRFDLDKHRGKERELVIAFLKESERLYITFRRGESLSAINKELDRLVIEQVITRTAANKILNKAEELLMAVEAEEKSEEGKEES